MKALQITKYGDIQDSLAFNEVEKPSINAQDVLIQVKAAALNPIDRSNIVGSLQAIIPLQFPSTISYDLSGVVVEKGAEVTDFEIGDLVYSRVPQEQMGSVAEFAAVQSVAVSKKPANITFEEAAGLPLAGLTALQSLEAANIKESDKVLIHAGSGGVGSFAIQYAKAKGAFVYTTTSTTNVEWVKALGADRVIDYKKEDYKEIVKDADIVFDTLGKEYSVEAFQVVKQGGKVVSVVGPIDEDIANAFGMTGYQLPEDLAAAKNAKDASYKFVFMHPNGAHLAQIKTMVEEDLIKPIVDSVFPFSEGIEAIHKLGTGRAKGKIIVKID